MRSLSGSPGTKDPADRLQCSWSLRSSSTCSCPLSASSRPRRNRSSVCSSPPGEQQTLTPNCVASLRRHFQMQFHAVSADPVQCQFRIGLGRHVRLGFGCCIAAVRFPRAGPCAAGRPAPRVRTRGKLIVPDQPDSDPRRKFGLSKIQAHMIRRPWSSRALGGEVLVVDAAHFLVIRRMELPRSSIRPRNSGSRVGGRCRGASTCSPSRNISA